MDAVRRRLAAIDRQLAGWDYHRRIVSTCPLVFVAAGLIMGIIIQHSLSALEIASNLPMQLWLALLILASASAVLLYILQTRSRLQSDTAPILLGICALICFACLGAIRTLSFHNAGPNAIRNFVTDKTRLATIRGTIISQPSVTDNSQWAFGRFKPGDPTSSFYLKLTEAESTDDWAKVTGTVRVQVSEPVLDLRVGDLVQAYCWLDRFKPATNPGQFDVAGYLARKNVFVAASVKSRDGIELLHRPAPDLFTRIRIAVRQGAAHALTGDLTDNQPGKGLLQALLLGYRGDIDNVTYQAFRKTGLLHFISLSGMHMGILIGFVWWISKAVGLLRRGRAVVCIIAIGVFLLIVPPRAPTLRAAIIGWVFCLSILFRRRSNPINTLSLAAIVLLLIRPTHLFEAGWQLSFATVLGILLLTERIQFLAREAIARRPWHKNATEKNSMLRTVSMAGFYAANLLSVGLAAWLGGAGILLYHFHTITPLACLWTVLVFPLVAAILTIGFAKMLLYYALPTLSTVLGYIVSALCTTMIWAVKKLAFIDIVQVLIGHVPMIVVVLYYCLILSLFFWHIRRPIVKQTTFAIGFLLLACLLGTIKWHRTHHNELILTCLDVGHGQAILAQLPHGGNVLFDAGSLHTGNVGGRIVTPFLDHEGIGRIDAIIISHNDIDHLNGIPEIVQACSIGKVYAGNSFLQETDNWGTAKQLKESLDNNRIQIMPVPQKLTLGGDASLEFIWPNENTAEDSELSDNDRSLVCLIRFGRIRVLLCSDIEKYAQQQILRLYPNLKADVLIAPHHGSRRTTDPEFIRQLGANVVVYSCGQSQYEQLHRTEKPADQDQATPKSLYTPKDGAITVSIQRNGRIRTATYLAQKK